MIDPAFLDLTGSLNGFSVWLDDERLSEHATLDEARQAYRAALALATGAREQLTRTLEIV